MAPVAPRSRSWNLVPDGRDVSPGAVSCSYSAGSPPSCMGHEVAIDASCPLHCLQLPLPAPHFFGGWGPPAPPPALPILQQRPTVGTECVLVTEEGGREGKG